MLRTHLHIALRTLRAHPGLTAINLVGLAVGLTVFFLIGLYVRHEFSYDRFHAHADRISRVVVDMNGRNGAQTVPVTQSVLAPTIHQDVPDVEHVVRIDTKGEGILRIGDRYVREPEVIAADSAFFEVFSFELRRGNAQTALAAPGSIVLTESSARRLFGDADPMGEPLQWNDQEELRVTGIVADPPRASHLVFNAIVSFTTVERADPEGQENWMGFSLYTYVLQREGRPREVVEARVAGLVERYAKAEMEEDGMEATYRLEPLTDIRLRSTSGGMGATGQFDLMLLFAGIGGFVLVVAGVNFVNLATARAMERAREVGIRKTLGASQGALVRQFLTESVVLAAVAFGLAVLLTGALLPVFEQLAGQTFDTSLGGRELLGLAAVPLVVGLLAGSYPAWVLSSFPPARILQANPSAAGGGGPWVRRGLVVVQFAISIGLVAATAVTVLQLHHLQNRNLGLDFGDGVQSYVLALPFGGDAKVQQSLPALREELSAIPGVTAVAASFRTPGDNETAIGAGTVQGAAGAEERATLHLIPADARFAEVYGLELVAGRWISDDHRSDTTGVYVLNETAVRRIGYPSPEAALGKEADFWGVRGPVVGVVRDFHTQGLQNPIPALALVARPRGLRTLSVRLETTDVQPALQEIERRWSALAPHQPFTYQFVDAQFDAQYRSEERFGQIFGISALLSILIACLGLFGLAAYSVQRRTKEIGVRRVLGASVPSIVGLLSTDYARLVGVAFVMAAPATYVGMQQWLSSFPYRIELGPGLFLLAGCAVLLLALATVGSQAWSAAHLDPTTALRRE